MQKKYSVKTDVEQSQKNNLQHFPLYLDCRNNHYEVDLLGTSTFKPIPYSSWIKKYITKKTKTTQTKIILKKDLFPLTEKENLTDNVDLSGPPKADSKYTIKHVLTFMTH